MYIQYVYIYKYIYMILTYIHISLSHTHTFYFFLSSFPPSLWWHDFMASMPIIFCIWEWLQRVVKRWNRAVYRARFKGKVKRTQVQGDRDWRGRWSVGQHAPDRSALPCGRSGMTHGVFVATSWSLSFQRLRPRLRGPPGPERGDGQETVGRQLRAPGNRVGLKERRLSALTLSRTELFFFDVLLTFSRSFLPNEQSGFRGVSRVKLLLFFLCQISGITS